MKKLHLIFTLIALMASTFSFSQNTLVAVLSHDNNVQMFYGPSALKNAVEVAVSGDVITLSAGQFAPCKITKGITIRGMGAEGNDMTWIKEYSANSSGTISISIPESDENNFIIEGINLTSATNILGTSKGYIAKCKTSTISFNSTSSANIKMVNCNVSGLALNGSSNLKLSNCRVNNLTNSSNTTSKADIFNCYLTSNEYTGGLPYRCSFVNCLIYYTSTSSSGTLPADASAMNSIFIKNSSGGTRVDCYNATVPQVFASYENKLVDSRYGIYADVPTTDQLSETAKATYLGTDGKEVGIYGGQYPYSLTPTYPLITKLNVAKQASADNKLSVEIEVTATE